ncbi:MAG: hypothetical protein FGM40_08405 [Rhodocyclaceae bacterium]|nr:hypothetical protein [Rhodocyclaceae bacterium]
MSIATPPRRPAAMQLLVATPDAGALLADWPDLARRLAPADHHREDFLALEDWLLALHGVPAEAEPALAAGGLGVAGRGHGWLRLDALSLVISRDRLVALPQRPDDAADGAALIDAVLPQLPPVGTLHAGNTQRLLDLDAPPEARFAPAWRSANRPLDEHLPQGPRGAEWRRWLTEAQMLLHEHPLNVEREARGLRPLNALWLSGGAASAPTLRDCGVRLLGTHPFAATLPVDTASPQATPLRRYGASPAGAAAPQITVWCHAPGQTPSANLARSLAAASIEVRILEPSGQQCYTRRAWHALRVWRKPLATLSPGRPQ